MMPLRFFKVLTGGKPADELSAAAAPSTINEKTLGDFIRMVRLTGILKLPKADKPG